MQELATPLVSKVWTCSHVKSQLETQKHTAKKSEFREDKIWHVFTKNNEQNRQSGKYIVFELFVPQVP